jgi:hypothetical protein
MKQMSRTSFSNDDRLAGYRKSYFESGVILEPFLVFGGGHRHPDPKTGLGLYGPYTLNDQNNPSLSEITVGMVGTGITIANTQQWLQACENVVLNDGSEPFLHPHFPGFSSDFPFQCKLIYGNTWCELLNDTLIDNALKLPNIFNRIKEVVSLFITAIETLSQRDPRPDVILCCIPQAVIDYCTTRVTKAGEVKRIRKPKSEKYLERFSKLGQIFLLPDMDPGFNIEDDEFGHHNLRRGLKAEAMQFGIPTQLVWPRTTQLAENSTTNIIKTQDAATRAWNFMTALYYKAGGIPWRLDNSEYGTCFIGVSFYRETNKDNPFLRTAMAQTFTATGDGYVLRGNTFEWNERMSPHLDHDSASKLINDVLDLYKRQNSGMLPKRLVLHKSSRFLSEELMGFREACKSVPIKDFVTIGQRGIQFFRTGIYPALRGTYVKFSDTNILLYTVGYTPFLRTYPGAGVPQPLEILEHIGDTPWNMVVREVLSLTKMNWNSADFSCSEPITLAFSRRVGQILAELPSKLPLKSEYRYYM